MRALCVEAARPLGRPAAVSEKKAAVGRSCQVLLYFQQELRSRRRKDGWAQCGAAPRLGVEVLNSPPLIVSLKQRCEKKRASMSQRSL